MGANQFSFSELEPVSKSLLLANHFSLTAYLSNRIATRRGNKFSNRFGIFEYKCGIKTIDNYSLEANDEFN